MQCFKENMVADKSSGRNGHCTFYTGSTHGLKHCINGQRRKKRSGGIRADHCVDATLAGIICRFGMIQIDRDALRRNLCSASRLPQHYDSRRMQSLDLLNEQHCALPVLHGQQQFV